MSFAEVTLHAFAAGYQSDHLTSVDYMVTAPLHILVDSILYPNAFTLKFVCISRCSQHVTTTTPVYTTHTDHSIYYIERQARILTL
jgi:hypothetical protein